MCGYHGQHVQTLLCEPVALQNNYPMIMSSFNSSSGVTRVGFPRPNISLTRRVRPGLFALAICLQFQITRVFTRESRPCRIWVVTKVRFAGGTHRENKVKPHRNDSENRRCGRCPRSRTKSIRSGKSETMGFDGAYFVRDGTPTHQWLVVWITGANENTGIKVQMADTAASHCDQL